MRSTISYSRWVVALSVIGILVALCFQTRYTAQHLKEETARIEKQIASEQKNMQLLKAEWSYLTRPERLSQLMASLEGDVPVTTKTPAAAMPSVVTLASLPVAAEEAPVQVAGAPKAEVSPVATIASVSKPVASVWQLANLSQR